MKTTVLPRFLNSDPGLKTLKWGWHHQGFFAMAENTLSPPLLDPGPPTPPQPGSDQIPANESVSLQQAPLRAKMGVSHKETRVRGEEGAASQEKEASVSAE